MLAFAKLVRTYQVNTQGVPWDDLGIWFWGELPKLLVLGFKLLTNIASSTHRGDGLSHSLPAVMLAHGEFHPSFPRMQ